MIIALTGHRDGKLQEEPARAFASGCFELTRPEMVICGMANGFDLWGGHEAVKMGIPVLAAVPWETHAPRTSDKELYQTIMDYAQVVYVTDFKEYPGPWVYQKRNEYMVDECDRVIAAWDGSASGTGNCIEYAKSRRPIKRFNPVTGEITYEGVPLKTSTAVKKGGPPF